MVRIEKYKNSFGVIAKEYKKYRWEYIDDLFKLLLTLRKVKEGSVLRVLDLGCGVGNSTEPFLAMAQKLNIPVSIIGCDVDPRMLSVARTSATKQKLPITYVEGKAERLPFQAGQFDLVISGAAFHWFATKKAMKQVQRVLGKGGVYAAFWSQNLPSKDPYIGRELYQKYKWQGIPKKLRTPPRVKEIFAESGFKKVTVTSIPCTEELSIADAVGLAITNSSYAILSEKDKKDFKRELTKEYKRVLGSKNEVTKQLVHVCYGVRPSV